MREENARLSKSIDELYGEKSLMEKKLYKIQQSFEDRMTSDREIIEKLHESLFIYENKLREKHVGFELMRSQIQRQSASENYKKLRHVFVVEPTKLNIDLNNELNYTRDILAKISKLMNSEKTKSDTMQGQIRNQEEELNLYRKNNKAFQVLAKEIKLGRCTIII